MYTQTQTLTLRYRYFCDWRAYKNCGEYRDFANYFDLSFHIEFLFVCLFVGRQNTNISERPSLFHSHKCTLSILFCKIFLLINNSLFYIWQQQNFGFFLSTDDVRLLPAAQNSNSIAILRWFTSLSFSLFSLYWWLLLLSLKYFRLISGKHEIPFCGDRFVKFVYYIWFYKSVFILSLK